MNFSFKVAGRLPTLNELIELRARSVHAYNKRKSEAHHQVAVALNSEKAEAPAYTWVFCKYYFYEPNRRFDPSNVAFGAIKCIEDALQLYGVLDNDGWSAIRGPDGIQFSWHHVPGMLPAVVVSLEGETDGRRTAAARRRDKHRERQVAQVKKAKRAAKRAQYPSEHGAAPKSAAKRTSKKASGKLH